MQLCFSCQHPFPPTSLQQYPFSDALTARLDVLATIVREVSQGASEHMRDRATLAEVILKELYNLIMVEVRQRKHSSDTALVQCGRTEARGGGSAGQNSLRNLASSANRAAAEKLPLRLVKTSPSVPRGDGYHDEVARSMLFKTVGTGAGSTLSRTSLAPGLTVSSRAASAGLQSLASATLGPVKAVNSSGKPACNPFQLVSASIYNIIDSLTARCRAEIGLLWLKPRGEILTELVAPFVVCREDFNLGGGAPLRVSAPCIALSVAESGVAINMGPSKRLGAGGLRCPTNLLHLVDNCPAATLLVPVFARYGRIARKVIGVVQLISSLNCPVQFSNFNEQDVAQAANCLSIIVSAYSDTMLHDWMNHIFDPSPMKRVATFSSYLDQSSDEKALDDFSLPKLLVLRCDNALDLNVDRRGMEKKIRAAMKVHAVECHPIQMLCSLHRHAENMEKNWVASVKKQVALERRLEEVTEIMVRHGIMADLQQLRGSDQVSNGLSDLQGSGRGAAIEAAWGGRGRRDERKFTPPFSHSGTELTTAADACSGPAAAPFPTAAGAAHSLKSIKGKNAPRADSSGRSYDPHSRRHLESGELLNIEEDALQRLKDLGMARD